MDFWNQCRLIMLNDQSIAFQKLIQEGLRGKEKFALLKVGSN